VAARFFLVADISVRPLCLGTRGVTFTATEQNTPRASVRILL